MWAQNFFNWTIYQHWNASFTNYLKNSIDFLMEWTHCWSVQSARSCCASNDFFLIFEKIVCSIENKLQASSSMLVWNWMGNIAWILAVNDIVHQTSSKSIIGLDVCKCNTAFLFRIIFANYLDCVNTHTHYTW